MSNSQLKREVNRLQSELRKIERENEALKEDIGEAVGAVSAAESLLVKTKNQIHQTLDNANTSLSESHQKVIQAYEMQQGIDAVYSRLKNMELANKKIRRCNNVKYYDFATYRKTRKLVQGIMDNMDLSMVSYELIASAVEKEHLESPEYWLTALLIAVASWKSDQKAHAYRALGQAMRLDPKKTASFMLVFNLRVGREEAAFKWFDALLDGQLMGSDKAMVLLFFSLLSKTIEDDISDESRRKVSTYIREQIDGEIAKSEETRGSAKKRISNTFRTFADNFDFPYPLISQYVSTSAQLKTCLALARNNANIINFISETVNVDEASRNEFLKQYIDFIVEDPCKAEAEVYEELERNELIIKYQGDCDAAEEAYEQTKLHDGSEFDIVTEMLDWVYTVEGRSEANPQMRKNMMVLTSSVQQDAGDDYIQFYQGLFSPNANVLIEGYEGRIDMSRPEQSNAEIETYYRGVAQAEKAEVKGVPAYVTMGVGAFTGAGLAVAVSPVLAAVGVACLMVGGGMLLINRSKKKRIDLKCEQDIRSVKNVFAEIGSEYKSLEAEYRDADLLSGKLQDKLAEL